MEARAWKTEIAKTEPQAAYAAFTKAYKSKFTFFQRTIIDFEEYLEPVDSLLYDSFIPTLFGSSTPPEIPSSLIALNPKDGGLGIQKPSEVSKNQFEASITKTAIHVETIIAQEQKMNKLSKEGESQKEIDSKIKKISEERRKHSIEALQKTWVYV